MQQHMQGKKVVIVGNSNVEDFYETMNHMEDRRRLESEIYMVPQVVPNSELNGFGILDVYFCWNYLNSACARDKCKGVHCERCQYHAYLKQHNVIGERRFLTYARDIQCDIAKEVK